MYFTLGANHFPEEVGTSRVTEGVLTSALKKPFVTRGVSGTAGHRVTGGRSVACRKDKRMRRLWLRDLWEVRQRSA